MLLQQLALILCLDMMIFRSPLPSYYCLLDGMGIHPRRVLLVEPDEGDRQFVHTTLEKLGYSVLSIGQMASTLSAITLYRPAIILLDVRSLDNNEQILDQIQSQQQWQVLPINIVSVFASNGAIA